MSRRPLTDQQSRVLAFVGEHLREHGFPPTLREIGGAVGLNNVNAVRGHVAALEKKGYLTRAPDKARSIQPVHGPSAYSRFKRVLHQIVGTDEGTFHRIVYGLAWATRGRRPCLQPDQAEVLQKAFENEAIEHGWSLQHVRIEPDHVVVVADVWPNHSAQQTVRRLQSAGIAASRRRHEMFPDNALWGRGYVATTELELLDGLVERLVQGEAAPKKRR